VQTRSPVRRCEERSTSAAGKTISEIFADHGEAHFAMASARSSRIADERPPVLATGAGFHECETGATSDAGVSIWLKAELPTDAAVMRRDTGAAQDH